MHKYDYLLDQITKSLQPSTGCTEPVAIALNSAISRKHAPGLIKKGSFQRK